MCGNINFRGRATCFNSNSEKGAMRGHVELRRDTGLEVTEESLSEVISLAAEGRKFRDHRRHQKAVMGDRPQDQ